MTIKFCIIKLTNKLLNSCPLLWSSRVTYNCHLLLQKRVSFFCVCSSLHSTNNHHQHHSCTVLQFTSLQPRCHSNIWVKNALSLIKHEVMVEWWSLKHPITIFDKISLNCISLFFIDTLDEVLQFPRYTVPGVLSSIISSSSTIQSTSGFFLGIFADFISRGAAMSGHGSSFL